MSTKLRCEQPYNSAEVELDADGLTGSDFVDSLVRPLMLALGYHPHTIAEALGEEPGNE